MTYILILVCFVVVCKYFYGKGRDKERRVLKDAMMYGGMPLEKFNYLVKRQEIYNKIKK